MNTSSPTIRVATSSEVSIYVEDARYAAGQLVTASDDGSVWQLSKDSAEELSTSVLATLSGLGRWLLTATPTTIVPPYFVFTPGAAQAGLVYGDFKQLATAIAALPVGSRPTVTLTDDFTVPTEGMPASGWGPLQRATFSASSLNPANTILTVPAGAKLDMLGGIERGLTLLVKPDSDEGSLVYSALESDEDIEFQVGQNASFVNLTATNKAAIVSPGDVTHPIRVRWIQVLARSGSSPASTGPYVRIRGSDNAVGTQIMARTTGRLPDGWIVGGSPGPSPAASALVYSFGLDSSHPITPGWTGSTPTSLNGNAAANLPYNDALVAPALGVTQVQAAIDALKAGIVPASGITTSQHAVLRQAVHLADGVGGPMDGFASGAYRETLPTGEAFPTVIIWWTNAGRTAKIIQKTIVLNALKAPSSIKWSVYDAATGQNVVAEVIDTIDYDGAFEVSRTRNITP